MKAPCAVYGCLVPVHAKGYCGPHYRRWMRSGDPTWQRPSFEERFWQRVDQRGPDECWPWTANREPRMGYGRFRREGRFKPAHRIAFELATGKPATGHVLHSCDNPPCCNPAHLREGSHDENMADKVERGRVARGSRISKRLTEDDVREIRRRVAAGEPQSSVAASFGIVRQAVSQIVHRHVWKHVA